MTEGEERAPLSEMVSKLEKDGRLAVVFGSVFGATGIGLLGLTANFLTETSEQLIQGKKTSEAIVRGVVVALGGISFTGTGIYIVAEGVSDLSAAKTARLTHPEEFEQSEPK